MMRKMFLLAAFCSAVALQAQDYYVVTGENVNVRSQPVTGKVVGKVSSVNSFTGWDAGNGWVNFCLPSVAGSVSGKFLRKVEPGYFSRTLLGDYMGRIGGVVLALFSAQAVRQWLWWIFLTFSVMIAGHMEISPADIRTGLRGLLYLLLLLLAVDAVLYMVWPAGLSGLTNGCMTFSCLITGFLTLSAVCATAMVLLAGIGRGVMALCGYRAY